MHRRKANRGQNGFTLIELLIVIVIIAALAVSVFVAINPVKRIADARDARRQSDVETIHRAIRQYIVDKGSLPTGLVPDGVERQLGTGTAAQCSPVSSGSCNVTAGTACVDLSVPLATYLKTIPNDPRSGTSVATLYSVSVDANSIVTVTACGTED